MIKNISVIGCGLIGRGWAIVFARSGFKVTIFDQDTKSLEAALKYIGESMSKLQELNLLSQDPESLCNNISCTTNLRDAVAEADYVQENITEDLYAKKNLFREMDQITNSKCILASSTSTILTSCFSGDLKGKERCIVAHPLNPPHLIPLVEISPAPYTSKAVLETTIMLHKTANQKPILVKKEIEGFILNRLQAALLLESWQLVKEGYVSVSDLDETVKSGLGHRWAFMGPFETIDLNAKKGIPEYAQIFGETYRKMMGNREYFPWSDALINQVETARREVTPEQYLEQRSQWRDSQLMELLQHKKEARDKLGD